MKGHFLFWVSVEEYHVKPRPMIVPVEFPRLMSREIAIRYVTPHVRKFVKAHDVLQIGNRSKEITLYSHFELLLEGEMLYVMEEYDLVSNGGVYSKLCIFTNKSIISKLHEKIAHCQAFDIWSRSYLPVSSFSTVIVPDESEDNKISTAGHILPTHGTKFSEQEKQDIAKLFKENGLISYPNKKCLPASRFDFVHSVSSFFPNKPADITNVLYGIPPRHIMKKLKLNSKLWQILPPDMINFIRLKYLAEIDKNFVPGNRYYCLRARKFNCDSFHTYKNKTLSYVCPDAPEAIITIILNNTWSVYNSFLLYIYDSKPESKILHISTQGFPNLTLTNAYKISLAEFSTAASGIFTVYYNY
jgi:hypothetical protein